MLLSFVAIIADWLTGEGLVFAPVKSLAIRIVSKLTYMEHSSIERNGSYPLAYFCKHEDTLTRRFLWLF